jgi:hypothetical protein
VAPAVEDAAAAAAAKHAAAVAVTANAAAAAATALTAYEARVDARWRARLARGDPLAERAAAPRVAAALDAWVEAQVIRHAADKWGSTLSAKLFLEKRFVLKHVRSKHGERLEAERARVLDEIFFESFRSEEEGRRGGGGGRGRGRGERLRGRGGRGGRNGPMMQHGGGAPMMVMVDPAMLAGMGGGGMLPMSGGMVGGAPMLVQGGMAGMAGIAGVPMMVAAPMMVGGGRGGGGGFRGGGRGGGRGGPPGGRGAGASGGYFDLDAPRNNRAVLDYGDL